MKKLILKYTRNLNLGQSLVEIVLAIGVAGVILPGLITGLVASRNGKAQQEKRVDAVSFLKEGQEAIRSVRESGWTSISTDGTYHPTLSSNRWVLAAGSETVNGLTRSIVISSVNRDTGGAIVQSGGILDPSTKKVVLTVSWTTPNASSIQSTAFVTRYLDNLIYLQSSQAEFNLGTLTQTATTNTTGGEVVLGTNVKGQWCQPNLSLASLDLPGKPNAVWAQEGYIFAATGDVAQASTTSFAHVQVSNTDTPTGTLLGSFKGYKTYDVWGDSNYAYIATSNDSKEVVIINLNSFSDPVNKIYAESGYFNTSSNSSDATSIFIDSARGYVAAGNYIYVFDLSSKTGSRPIIGTRIQFANSGDTAGEIYLRDVGGSKYLFVAIEGSTVEELKILNVTNHTNTNTWKVVGSINIEPNNCSTLESGKAVFVKPDGSRAYISSTNDTSFKEFFTINTSSKSSPSLVGGLASNPPCTNGGGYEAGGMDPEGSVVVSLTENRALLVGVDAAGGANSEEYQVLDLTNEGNPSKCGGLQFDQGIYGVSAVKEADGDAYAYIITGDTSNELKIIQGGPDGAYVESGTYESATFDAGYETVFNRIIPNVSAPSGTMVQFQVAGADPVTGSCTGASFTYTGPDGTSGTYYNSTQTTALALDNNGSGYENPARCFRYKAFLSTTNYNATPIVNDVTVNYSP